MTKILILDDDRTQRLFLKHELIDDGHEVVENSGSFRLLSIIERERPNLVIMDPLLRGLDGLDLLGTIRNTYYNLPVILWSARMGDRWDPRSMAADYQLVKSSDVGQLKGMIARVLETRMAGNHPGPGKLLKTASRRGAGGAGGSNGETRLILAEG